MSSHTLAQELVDMAVVSGRLSSCVGRSADGPPTSRRHSPSSTHPQESRRNLLAISLSSAFLATTTIPEYPPKSQLIEQLLEKSRANKTKNNQKRLNSYYERNFKEYFEFVEGTLQNRTDLSENEKDILKWLERTRSKKK
ncbi:hypothetical protein GOP47_0006402 [Adiantum capillus-veneris]|uniref:Uncharacterized protein n=1 Tax=Adiantum capillus-veneris TaxID=13818 RepID=A0A9D4ZMG3_ADICA|nr:hypothetical protein GOP47_0006402 [Adiantum capillus-veneris]